MKTCAIIITAYKAESYILESINSFNDQMIPEGWEIEFYIGVDAHVPTSDVLKDNNISHYMANENVGTYILSNSLIQKAWDDGCDVFLRFDSDDVACENFISYGILNCEMYNFSRTFCKETDEQLNPQNDQVKYANGAVFFNRDALNELGGYQPYRVSCDTDLTRRADILGFIPDEYDSKPVYFYRKHPQTLSNNKDTNGKSQMRKQAIINMNRDFQHGKIFIQPKTTDMSLWKSDT